MEISKSYLVCATPRSGSSLLCEVLTNSHIAGNPHEYFWKIFEPDWSARWEVTDYADYVQSAIACTSTPNGVFGAKIMWEHLDYFVERLRTLRGGSDGLIPDLLAATFPHLQYVWIYRRDTLRQAVSLWRALQTWVWNETGEPKEALAHPVFNYDEIDRLVREIAEHNASWEAFFAEHNIQPFIVTYETLVEAPETVGRQVLQYLGIPLPEPLTFAPRRLRKQADTLSEDWVARYRAIQAGAEDELSVSAAECEEAI